MTRPKRKLTIEIFTQVTHISVRRSVGSCVLDISPLVRADVLAHERWINLVGIEGPKEQSRGARPGSGVLVKLRVAIINPDRRNPLEAKQVLSQIADSRHSMRPKDDAGEGDDESNVKRSSSDVDYLVPADEDDNDEDGDIDGDEQDDYEIEESGGPVESAV